MKKYHVYGIGNALVDMEFEVTPEFLSKEGIEKGVMTLVDEGKQSALLEAVQGIQHKRGPGGSAANTIAAVGILGGRTFYSCRVANDEAGEFYFNDLLKAGISTNLHGQRAEGVTGKCMVFVTPDADRSMNTFLGASSEFDVNDVEESELVDSEYLYIEGYLVGNPHGKEAAMKAKAIARENGVKIALTFSDPFMVENCHKDFEDLIEGGIDLLFCNISEAMTFTKTDSAEAAMAILKEKSKIVAITMGESGAYIFDGNKEIYILTQRVDAVDTNGAGDLFAGCFMWGLTQGKDLGTCGRLACFAASKLVTQFGARLDAEELKEIQSFIVT